MPGLSSRSPVFFNVAEITALPSIWFSNPFSTHQPKCKATTDANFHSIIICSKGIPYFYHNPHPLLLLNEYFTALPLLSLFCVCWLDSARIRNVEKAKLLMVTRSRQENEEDIIFYCHLLASLAD